MNLDYLNLNRLKYNKTQVFPEESFVHRHRSFLMYLNVGFLYIVICS